MSRWANSTRWLDHDEWSFAYFTGGPSDAIIADYNSFSRLAMKILTEKSKDYIDAVKQNFARLVASLQQEEDVETRLNVVTTLSGLRTPEAISVLEGQLQTEREERLLASISYHLSLMKSRRQM